MSTVCEVPGSGGWKQITAHEAAVLRPRNKRCIECHKPVRAHKLSNNGMAAHFEHLRKNPSCSLSDHR
jgi:hypothetical protein